MIKLTLKQIVDSYDSLLKFSTLKVTDLNLSSYSDIRNITKLTNQIKEEFKIFQKTINELIEKYGQKNEKTGNFEIKGNTKEFEAYKSEYDELLKSEIEFEHNKIKIKVNIQKFELSIYDIEMLEIYFDWS